MSGKRRRLNKKGRERRKAERAEREAKARCESEQRQARIKVLWEELLEKKNETQDYVRQLGNSELGKTLLELLALQKEEIDYVTKNQREGEETCESRALASALLDKLRIPKPTSKQLSEWKRRRRHGVGLIEREFGGVSEHGSQTLLSANKTASNLLSPTCLDEIFAGGAVNMLRLEELFGMDRNRFPRLPNTGKARQKYDYRAVVKIMHALLSETPSHKTRGRPLRTWPSRPNVRSRVLNGIKGRINRPPMPEQKFLILTIPAFPSIPEHIKAAFVAVVHKHLPDSAKK